MRRKAHAARSYWLFLTVLLLLLCEVQGGAQKREAASRGKSAKTSVEKKYVVGPPINLTLLRCTGKLDFANANLVGDQLDIQAGEVSISANGSVVKRGEVIAYARSQYFLDSNAAFIFDRSKELFTDSKWKPPLIVSLLLIQNRKNLKQFSLAMVPTAGGRSPTSIVSCTSIEGSAGR